MNGTPNTTGERVRHYRMARQMTQEQLASAATMNRASVSLIETDANQGHITVRTATRLAEALGVRLIDLLPREPVRKRTPSRTRRG